MDEKIVAALVEALRWYVHNDDVNEGDPENNFFIDGKERAKAALASFDKSQS